MDFGGALFVAGGLFKAGLDLGIDNLWNTLSLLLFGFKTLFFFATEVVVCLLSVATSSSDWVPKSFKETMPASKFSLLDMILELEGGMRLSLLTFSSKGVEISRFCCVVSKCCETVWAFSTSDCFSCNIFLESDTTSWVASSRNTCSMSSGKSVGDLTTGSFSAPTGTKFALLLPPLLILLLIGGRPAAQSASCSSAICLSKLFTIKDGFEISEDVPRCTGVSIVTDLTTSLVSVWSEFGKWWELVEIWLSLVVLPDVEDDFSLSFLSLDTVKFSTFLASALGSIADLLLEVKLVLLRAGESTSILSVVTGLSSKGTGSVTLCLSTEDREL